MTLWADTDVVHLLVAGTGVKSLRSHLSMADLTRLASDGGRPAGPPPLPSTPLGGMVEVDRSVKRTGSVSLAGHVVMAADILAGRRVTVRVEQHTLAFLDPDSRTPLRTRPNPLTGAEIGRLQGARPAGPPPQPSTDPVRVQRRAGHRHHHDRPPAIAMGRVHAGKTLTVQIGDTT